MQESNSDHIELISVIENGEFDEASQILARDSTNRCVLPVGDLQVTALQMAAWQGNMDLLNELYEKGADINSMDKIGRCALYYAAHNGNVDVTKWLLQHGGHTDVKVGNYSDTMDVPYSSLIKSCNVGRKVRTTKIIGEFFIRVKETQKLYPLFSMLRLSCQYLRAGEERRCTRR